MRTSGHVQRRPGGVPAPAGFRRCYNEVQGAPMKAKKALRRLEHVADLLSSVLVQYAAKKPSVQELLNSAKTSVSRAQKSIQQAGSAAKAKWPVVPAKEGGQQNAAPASRRKAASAAQKQRALTVKKATNRNMASRKTRAKNGHRAASKKAVVKRGGGAAVHEKVARPKTSERSAVATTAAEDQTVQVLPEFGE